MGFLSKLFGGKKPKKRQASAAELEMLARATQLKQETARYRPYQDAHIKDVMDTSGERQALTSTSAADVGQAFRKPTPMSAYDRGGSALFDSALQRGKGLSRILAAGDQAVEQQSIRDRASIVSFGRARAAGAAGGFSAIASMAERRAAGKATADEYVDRAKSNLFGTLAGAGANIGIDYWQRNRLPGKRMQYDPPPGTIFNPDVMPS